MEISDVQICYDGPMKILEKNENGLMNGQTEVQMHNGKAESGGDQKEEDKHFPGNNGGKKAEPQQAPSTQTKPSGLYYDVQDNPPIHLAILFGFQIAMANILGCVNMTVIISQFICADQQFATSLYTTTTVMSGIGTILQTSFGVRLPIFQGPSILFTFPFLNARTDPAWGCQTSPSELNTTNVYNETLGTERLQPWLPEWRKIQGSLMVASVLQTVIGCLGVGGLLLRMMGPISITCIILLLGISLNTFIAAVGEVHWGMSFLNIAMVVVLSMYVNKVEIPFPHWSKKEGFRLKSFPFFGLFPVLLSTIVGWIISHICTVAGVFTDNPDELEYQARTDFGLDAIRDAPILAFPYPGQFGAPSFKVSYAAILVVAVLGSILESVGDYVQTSVACAAPFPPAHAINRGIMAEGFCSLISGVVGAGHATTSYSNNIGIIGVTKVASRLVFNIAGVIILLMGVLGKLGAVFVAIPKPVLAGPMFIAIALLIGASLSNLDRVDLRSGRTQGVLGVAILAGSVFPAWISSHPDAFNTGSVEFDQTLSAVLGMPLVVGAILAIFLDMTLPGNSRLEPMEIISRTKGSLEGNGTDNGPRQSVDASVYNLPFITKWTSTWRLTRYIPFLPNPEEKRRSNPTPLNESLQISSSRTELF